MIDAIDAVRVRGDSVGGVVTCIVRNVPRVRLYLFLNVFVHVHMYMLIQTRLYIDGQKLEIRMHHKTCKCIVRFLTVC